MLVVLPRATDVILWNFWSREVLNGLDLGRCQQLSKISVIWPQPFKLLSDILLVYLCQKYSLHYRYRSFYLACTYTSTQSFREEKVPYFSPSAWPEAHSIIDCLYIWSNQQPLLPRKSDKNKVYLKNMTPNEHSREADETVQGQSFTWWFHFARRR